MGALFRTADGAGISEIILSGYTPEPAKKGKLVLTAAEKELHKTALGAEETMPWRRAESLQHLLSELTKEGYILVALEQSEKSVDYRDWKPKGNTAVLIGNEVSGVDKEVLDQCDVILEIPMRGKKNSLNVSVASGIALYQITSRIERGE